MSTPIGFMQGRLCQQVGSKIQAFPWEDWKSEFPIAESIGLKSIEWTLDHEQLSLNPLLTPNGQLEIQALSKKYSVDIPSLTGDCFMQAPFWKTENKTIKSLLKEVFLAVIEACSKVGIKVVVIPLVDNGRLESRSQENELVDFLVQNSCFFEQKCIRLAFESDFTPVELRRMMKRLPSLCFGINYDIGNSACLGFNPVEEFAAYGSRIINIHVKDRVLRGPTVPLGTGAAQFATVFSEISKCNYTGNLILQTARAEDGNHISAICRYQKMVAVLVNRFKLTV